MKGNIKILHKATAKMCCCTPQILRAWGWVLIVSNFFEILKNVGDFVVRKCSMLELLTLKLCRFYRIMFLTHTAVLQQRFLSSIFYLIK